MLEKSRRKLYVNDLNCQLYPIHCFDETTDNETDDEIYRILVKSMYNFDNSCTRLLIQQIKMLIQCFINGNDKYFSINKISDGNEYYRFSNDANLAMNFVPLPNGAYLLTFSSAIEME